MQAFVKHALAVALFGPATTSICHAQAARPADVAPRDAVTTIIDAFREHPVVETGRKTPAGTFSGRTVHSKG
jgi:hypothetical protein